MRFEAWILRLFWLAAGPQAHRDRRAKAGNRPSDSLQKPPRILLRFGLKDVTELPSMEEFEKMAAAELEEPDVEGRGRIRSRDTQGFELGTGPDAQRRPAEDPTGSATAVSPAAEDELNTPEAAADLAE